MSDPVEQKQYLLLYGIISILSIVIIVVLVMLFNAKSLVKAQKKSAPKSFATGTSRVNPQEAWVHDFTHKAEVTQKRLETLEQTLEKLIKLNTRTDPTSSVPITSVANLRREITTTVQGTDSKKSAGDFPPQPQNAMELLKKSLPANLLKGKELKKITLHLSNSRHQSALKTTDNTIPAGAFAEAILLGGVDASTSIQASSDPRPILLRLTDPGTLPRRFKSDLYGCHVLAASYGDISSERVFMRLEKLSCVERKTGEVMEMNIKGYVAGEDGRAGIRGSIVDRAGVNMRNAMMGGFFSSVGKFLGQARSPLLFSPSTGLAEQNPLTTNDILKQSAGNGMSGALDKYADFYIKRAEQMQPVIQVAAGRKVDIVFTEGFDFSDSALRKMLTKTNDQKRFQQVQSLEETKPVPTWLPNDEGNP
jgi:conjugal transfer pilus assembly protein TraB